VSSKKRARAFMEQISKLMAASRMIGFQDAIGTRGQQEQARAEEKDELNKLLDILSPAKDHNTKAETWH